MFSQLNQCPFVNRSKYHVRTLHGVQQKLLMEVHTEQRIQNIKEPEAIRLFKYKYKHRLERKQEETNGGVIPEHI